MTEEYYRDNEDVGILDDVVDEGDPTIAGKVAEAPRHAGDWTGGAPMTAGTATGTGDPAGINPQHVQEGESGDGES